jgi:hypothetical protein
MHLIIFAVVGLVGFAILAAMWESPGGKRIAIPILVVIGSSIVSLVSDAAGNAALWLGLIGYAVYVVVTWPFVRRVWANYGERREKLDKEERQQAIEAARRARSMALVAGREAERQAEDSSYLEKRLGLLLSNLWQHCALLDGSQQDGATLQAMKWKWKFLDLCRHLAVREGKLREQGRATRFLAGNLSAVNRMARVSRFKESKPEIMIVQPGLSKQDRTKDQSAVLAAAVSYLKETIGVDLDVLCSA